MSIENIEALKKFGDFALDSGNYGDALKHYSEALNLLIQNYNTANKECLKFTSEESRIAQLESSLYSKRSVALLKLSQYYYAYEDAIKILSICPEWFKGYLRKADIELDCGLYESALKDYQMALRYLDLKSTNSKGVNYHKFINQKISHVLFMMQRERSFDYQIPWIGAALGLVVGMAIVTWDYVSNGTRSYINHPILKLACIGLVAYIFFHLATIQRSLTKKHKQELLKPPYGSMK